MKYNNIYLILFRLLILAIGVLSLLFPFQELKYEKVQNPQFVEYFLADDQSVLVFICVFLFFLFLRYFFIPRLNAVILIIGFFAFLYLLHTLFITSIFATQHILLGGKFILLLYPLMVIEYFIQKSLISKADNRDGQN